MAKLTLEHLRDRCLQLPGARRMSWLRCLFLAALFIPAAAASQSHVKRINVSSFGAEANAASSGLGISADGSYAAFSSEATNLGHPTGGLFLHEVNSASTSWIASSGSGYSLNSDGRFLVFTSEKELVKDDTNLKPDVFVYDRRDGSFSRSSVATDGTQANDGSVAGLPGISSDGRLVVFQSHASNLVANDDNGAADVFLRDRLTQTTERLSVNQDGIEGNGDSGLLLSMSRDGRFVAYHTKASNLVTVQMPQYEGLEPTFERRLLKRIRRDQRRALQALSFKLLYQLELKKLRSEAGRYRRTTQRSKTNTAVFRELSAGRYRLRFRLRIKYRRKFVGRSSWSPNVELELGSDP